MLNKLEKEIEILSGKNHKIIMMLDANESRTRTVGYTYGAMVERLQMMPVMDELLDDMLPSTIRGKSTIDHMELLGVDTTTVLRKGQLPHGIVFASDHLAM